MPEMLMQLTGVERCPHCSIASPLLNRVWGSGNGEGTHRTDGGMPKAWALYLCSSCGGGVLAEASGSYHGGGAQYIYPAVKAAHTDIPPVARRFLQQAMDTLHAPDAAAVMAGASVDAMLKEKGYIRGSLYERIDQALSDNVLTSGMATWAHSVRLGSNRPRHADAENPHVSLDQAKQSVAFAEALGSFLFVLTARIDRGIEAANSKADAS